MIAFLALVCFSFSNQLETTKSFFSVLIILRHLLTLLYFILSRSRTVMCLHPSCSSFWTTCCGFWQTHSLRPSYITPNLWVRPWKSQPSSGRAGPLNLYRLCFSSAHESFRKKYLNSLNSHSCLVFKKKRLKTFSHQQSISLSELGYISHIFSFCIVLSDLFT